MTESDRKSRGELEQLARRWRSEAHTHARAGDVDASVAATERAEAVEADLRALDERKAEWMRRGEAAADRVDAAHAAEAEEPGQR
jgi:23S rRNA maturation mini-RNase III